MFPWRQPRQPFGGVGPVRALLAGTGAGILVCADEGVVLAGISHRLASRERAYRVDERVRTGGFADPAGGPRGERGADAFPPGVTGQDQDVPAAAAQWRDEVGAVTPVAETEIEKHDACRQSLRCRENRLRYAVGAAARVQPCRAQSHDQ